MNNFGSLLNYLRLNQGLTQCQLAQKLGVDFTYISHMEKDNTIPTDEIIEKAAEILNTDSDSLLLSAGKVPPSFKAVLLNDSLAVAFIKALPKFNAKQRAEIQNLIYRVKEKNIDEN